MGQPANGFAGNQLCRVAFELAYRLAIANKVVGILVAGMSIVVSRKPVIVTMIAGLRKLGFVELPLGIQVPFAHVASFIADRFEERWVSDFTLAQMRFVRS